MSRSTHVASFTHTSTPKHGDRMVSVFLWQDGSGYGLVVDGTPLGHRTPDLRTQMALACIYFDGARLDTSTTPTPATLDAWQGAKGWLYAMSQITDKRNPEPNPDGTLAFIQGYDDAYAQCTRSGVYVPQYTVRTITNDGELCAELRTGELWQAEDCYLDTVRTQAPGTTVQLIYPNGNIISEMFKDEDKD